MAFISTSFPWYASVRCSGVMLQFLLSQCLHKCILSILSTTRENEQYHNGGDPMESKTNLLPLLREKCTYESRLRCLRD